MKKLCILIACAGVMLPARAIKTASPDGNVVADFNVVDGVPV